MSNASHESLTAASASSLFAPASPARSDAGRSDATRSDAGRSGWNWLGEPALAFIVMAIANGAYLFYKGVFIAPDSSFYMRGARQLLESGFDIPAFLAEFPRYAEYIGFVSWCAVLKAVFAEAWPVAIVVTNGLCNALTATLIVAQLKRLQTPWLTRCLAIAWCAIAFDLMVWSKGLLSDTTFLLLSTTAILGWANLHWRRVRILLPLVVLTALAVCWRPTGIALIPPVIAVIAFRNLPWLRRMNRIGIAAGAVLFLELVFVLFAYYMQNPDDWPLPAGQGNISYTAHYYDDGQVVWKRYETYHEPPESVLDYHLITLDRLAHWFAMYAEEFSRSHTLYNVLFYTPLFAGGLLAAFHWIRRRHEETQAAPDRADAGTRPADPANPPDAAASEPAAAASEPANESAARANTANEPARTANEPSEGTDTRTDTVVFTLLAVVYSFTALHAMLQVDYGWRYRVPIIPSLIMLTAIAAGVIVKGRFSRTPA